MIRISKDVIKILFLLAGVLFIKNGFAQVSLVMKGGAGDGVYSSVLSPCAPATMTASGGSYDGSSILTQIACNLPTTLVTAGGGQDGIYSSVLASCSRPTMVAAGGAYDGSSILTQIACNLPTTLVTAGGGQDGIYSSALGNCSPITAIAAGGAYDGSSILTQIACNLPTTLVTAGGGQDGIYSSALANCSLATATAAGGAYDGSSILTQIACNLPTTLVTAGGAQDGLYSSVLAFCSRPNMVAAGGAYDGAELQALVCHNTLYISSIDATPAVCSCNGVATVNATGATPPYTYAWSSGSTNSAATGLCAGVYYVTIMDAASGEVTGATTIAQSGPTITTTASTVSTNCGNSNGSATVSVSGGTPPYSYNWSSGSSTSASSGLVAGTYTVTITESGGCTVTKTAIVSNIPGPTATISSQTNVSCNGGSNGSASVSANGGAGSYTYLWSNTSTGSAISNLASSIYNVTVTDGASCTGTATVNITQPPAMSATASSQTNVSCNGGSNGSATVLASGGTGAYTYLWNTAPVQTTATAGSIAADSYSVTVKDANNCTTTAATTITEPVSLSVVISKQTNVSCNGGSNGTATVSASGGTALYSYLWSNSQTDVTATGLSSATYAVTVIDAHGCSAVTSAAITQPSVLSVSAASNSPVCSTNPLNLSSTVVGGTSGYSYSWTGPSGFSSTDANPVISSSVVAQTGYYTVIVTDANLCTASAVTQVEVNYCFTTLSLNLYIQGYYQGSGFMLPAMFREGVVSSNNTQTDTILVALRDPVIPTTSIDSAKTILFRNGSATVTFPPAITSNSYYIVVKHRNSLETWSKNPVSFTTNTSYNFTTSNSQAYGDNLIQVDASPILWAVYSGDMNQDQNTDLIDFPVLDLGINQGLFGYYRSDLNGDGNTDLLDFPVLDGNINAGVFSRHP